MTTRPAAKAGTWYTDEPGQLENELRSFLARVPESIDEKTLPIAGARVIIAPHAGYDYSGPCAAWAYKSLDLRNVKRVFVLGPSHTYYLEGCAVSTFDKYATPFGDMTVDRDAIQRTKEAAGMDDIQPQNEISEHSLEMHMPYLYFRCQQTFETSDDFPKIVPLLIGDNSRADEKSVGRALASYLKDPENAFIVSSDFCHWGKRFGYTVYSPTGDMAQLKTLSPSQPAPAGPPIHETIRIVDEAAMDAVKRGNHDAYLDNLKLTHNTVYGRHPIGAMLAALETLAHDVELQDGKGKFQIVQYDRSNLVEEPRDFSVSYVSAYAVL